MTPKKLIVRVERLVSDGRYDRALELTEQGVKDWPANIRLRMVRARILEECGRDSEAMLVLAEMLGGDDGRSIAAQLAGMIESNVPDTDDAIAIVDATLKQKPAEPTIHTVFEALLEHADAGQKADCLAHMAMNSGLHRYEWRHANNLIEKGQWSAALELLERAYDEGRSVSISATTLAELMSISDRHDDATAVLRKLAEDDPNNTDAHRKLVKMAQRANAFDEGGQAMLEALEKWPADWLLVQRMNRLPIASDLRRQCHDLILSDLSEDPRLRFQQAIAAAFEGQTSTAVDLLAGSFPAGMQSLAEQVRRVLQSRDSSFWSGAGQLEDDRLNDVQVVPVAGSDTVVIVPSGITFGLLPINILAALLAERGVSAIFLKDFNKRAYMRGVRSLGNTIEDTVDKLDEISTSIGAKRKIFMGCSSGGFAAHRLAALSGAYAGVSFAGQADLESYYADTKPVIWNEEYLALQTLLSEPDINPSNIPFLESATDTRFLQYFGHNWPRDVIQAQKFSEIGSVELIGDEGSDHLVVNHMIADGRFDALLDDILATG